LGSLPGRLHPVIGGEDGAQTAQLRNATPSTKEDSTMKLFIIIILMCLAWLAWVWFRKPGWKRMPARTWPPGGRKTSLKPKLAPH
jgi:hypothetical protein